ncbi:nuclear transport factor 2 family protein [Dactylosporangium matsuzakiense]|uniref:SnoaL-like domain-containing protein n=1 Tax=Dactylosporangium matsuzakiense TaxID=53360 RepID=A0A9W6NT32_9ACTN|nr:nuclear transport factor 2 family protein [Dactylosporangium matsuzakiense]GLL08113.1 hypothetical protein GCM10017581_098730 [Dactylosporangium matsuzakiense]
MPTSDSATVARTYHDAWTSGRFDDAAALLADDLQVEVPINAYATRAAFADAVRAFGSMTREVRLLSALHDADEAMLLYDMTVDGLGTLRVAEHFTIVGGRITRLRQVHDTAPIRAAGLGA